MLTFFTAQGLAVGRTQPITGTAGLARLVDRWCLVLVLTTQDCEQARHSEAVVRDTTGPRYPSGDDKRLISVQIAYPRPTIRLVCVTGEVDMSTAPVLRDACTRDARGRAPVRHLVVDLSRVTFLASAGLHVLIECHAHFAAIAVVGNHPAVAVPLRITGLDGVLPVHACLDSALCVLDG
ncbi:STAS domain-containing protein [Pseudonocardia broussonetiae]|uniref:Anti-sigma factor antagonist n=1 Tax=Pseudonocardia broussonetiae TaxID=2736640 RepID=A0A6M6JN80_9PSEU|nr:STAS domain-containing protein [Pseudonocardia broussonetiae]QJY47771.1 STAS domain-containing protein [Pseudonocardia broussonetiae]